MTRCGITPFLLFGLLLAAAAPPLAAADELGRPAAWHVRAVASGALMVSSDQLSWLAYDQAGLLGDVQLGFPVLPWLDIQVGTALGVFLSAQANGGLAAPTVGALARIPTSAVTPYAFLDFGGAFTGALLLPMVRAGIGLELAVTDSLQLGPVLTFGSVLFSDDPGNSTDARYVALGLAGVYSPNSRPVPRQVAVKPPPPAAARVSVVREPSPESGREPPTEIVHEPSPEILKLIDRAVPGRTDQIELLAPVLFTFDSDVLEPVGVAMLHEVVRSLAERTELELIEIRAYSDARGPAEYNRQLAARRGQRVYDWLVEHDVEPSRLTVAPVGASEFVETGAAETAQEQNRRVVFRVLRIGEKK